MRYLLIIIGLVMSTSPVYSQSIYEDVLRLEKYVQDFGDEKRFDLLEESQDKGYIKILKKYVPESARDTLNTNGSFHYYFEEVGNTFLKDYFNEGAFHGIGIELIEAEAKKLPAAIGGLNATTIADGLVKFLVERANQELSIAFFDRLKNEIEGSTELSNLFPVSSRFLLQMDPLQYSYMLNAFREAFQEDISNLVTNIEDLVETDKYQNLITENDELKYIYVGLEAAQIVSKLSGGTHPADVIDGLGQHQKIEEVSSNLANSLKVISLFSSSIRDTTGENAYVSITELKNNIFDDPINQKIFLGLLYQRSLDIKFETDSTEVPVHFSEILINISNTGDNARQIVELYSNMESSFKTVKNSFDTIKNTPKDERTYLEYYTFFETVPDFIESNFENVEKLLSHKQDIKDFRDEVKKYVEIARFGNQIYKNINENNYASAIVNFVQIYDYAIGFQLPEITRVQQQILDGYLNCVNKIEACDTNPSFNSTKAEIVDLLERENTSFHELTFDMLTEAVKHRESFREKVHQYFDKKIFLDKQFHQKFLKYGMFIANVAQAENSDQVQAAIETAVLPVGSSRIKRQTKWNISINSYLGGFAGEEYLRESPDGKSSFTYGVSAPVGIAISRGFGYGDDKKKSVNSLSAFVSIIDVGAFASFRIQNEVEELPEFELQNIIAPGAYLAWNIGGTPLTVLTGFQLGPQLREIDVAGESDIVSSAWRFQAALTVDIPLFNLSTTPWN